MGLVILMAYKPTHNWGAPDMGGECMEFHGIYTGPNGVSKSSSRGAHSMLQERRFRLGFGARFVN